MASFEVNVKTIEVLNHPNADKLDLAKVDGYMSIIPKNKYKTGDKVVYIPEQSIVPDNIIKELGLEGKLAGKQKNRVKAIKLRGILSQGLIYPSKDEWEVNQDVKDELGIFKYEPPIPSTLSGEVESWDGRLSFDVENYKKYPHLIKDQEEVVLTEKIHGTCTLISYVPEDLRKDTMLDGKFAVISKGLSKQNLFFKDTKENREKNVYLMATSQVIKDALEKTFKESKDIVTLLGETFGKVQDLRYGCDGRVDFRAFGLKVGSDYLGIKDFLLFCKENNIPHVPVLYQGPFSQEVLDKYTDGKEQVSGQELNIREGVVIYPTQERYSEEIGRVFLKNVSGDYLTRKGGTEHN